MRMLQNKPISLSDTINECGDPSGCFVEGAERRLTLSQLVWGSSIDGRGEQLRGRSVVVLVADQLTAASVMLELDGIARRMVLCPPDLPLEYLPSVIAASEAEAIISDRGPMGPEALPLLVLEPSISKLNRQVCDRGAQCETEWILLTSGTSGPPKLVQHNLSSLSGAIKRGSNSSKKIVWSTFYDIRRYGGLQIFLRAALTGTSLVLSSATEPPAAFLARAGASGVTHISGTPSHWRRALMSPAAKLLDPEYVRLSGEIADQGILNQLRSTFPKARLAHAFASTEAGVAFEVGDEIAGFPAVALEQTAGVEMKVVDGSLRIRSARTASRYLGEAGLRPIRDPEGFVDTSDVVELREGRYQFLGRRDGVINVGGSKVHPEEIEAVINRHPRVEMSRVRTKKNPITGAIVVADVALKVAVERGSPEARALQHDILLFCRESLASWKIPGAIYFVPSLAVAETGKLVRRDA